MTQPEPSSSSDLEELGDRMDGTYQPPILTEPTGGPVPVAEEEDDSSPES